MNSDSVGVSAPANILSFECKAQRIQSWGMQKVSVQAWSSPQSSESASHLRESDLKNKSRVAILIGNKM